MDRERREDEEEEAMVARPFAFLIPSAHGGVL